MTVDQSVRDATLQRLLVDPDALDELCRRWKIETLSIFGSAARNEMRPDSDVDLKVVFYRDAHWSLWDVVDLRDELVDLFGREIDLVTAEVIRNPYRRRSIERDLQIIYAA